MPGVSIKRIPGDIPASPGPDQGAFSHGMAGGQGQRLVNRAGSKVDV